MRLFSRDIDELSLDALKKCRDKLTGELAEDRIDLEAAIARMVEKGRNKYAIERRRIMGQLSIEKDEAELRAVEALISNITGETASTAP